MTWTFIFILAAHWSCDCRRRAVYTCYTSEFLIAGSSRRCHGDGRHGGRHNGVRYRVPDDVMRRRHVVVRKQHGVQDGRLCWAMANVSWMKPIGVSDVLLLHVLNHRRRSSVSLVVTDSTYVWSVQNISVICWSCFRVTRDTLHTRIRYHNGGRRPSWWFWFVSLNIFAHKQHSLLHWSLTAFERNFICLHTPILRNRMFERHPTKCFFFDMYISIYNFFSEIIWPHRRTTYVDAAYC